NTPDRAFRTIAGAFAAASSRFLATPSFQINMKIGLPGDYVGAALGPFGGVMSLQGAGGGDRSQYRIHEFYAGSNSWAAIGVGDATLILSNLTLYQEISSGASAAIAFSGSRVVFDRIAFECTASNANSYLIGAQAGS